MSQSFSVNAIKPPSEPWKKMKAVWDACTAAGVTIPNEVERFFEDEPPDDKGEVTSLKYYKGNNPHPSLKEYENRHAGEQGYDVDLDKLPPEVTILRFVVSC